MDPTLSDGDLLLVRWGARPRAGSVAVVRWPGVPLAVKRLVLRQDDGWWVERDGTEGVDSVTLGTVPDDAVRARVVGRLWPRPGRIPPRPGRRPT